MAVSVVDPSRAQGQGSIWRETLARLIARLESEGLAPEQARELSESVVIVCALRYARLSLDDALAAAIDQAARMR